jgi:predicted nuclease with TOPRIM domain
MNQNLGPIKDSLFLLISKIDHLHTEYEFFKKEIEEIQKNLDKISGTLSEISKLSTKHNEFEIKKMELDTQLKIAELTQNQTTTREITTRRWGFWGAVITAILTTIGVVSGYLLKPTDIKDKDKEKKIESIK